MKTIDSITALMFYLFEKYINSTDSEDLFVRDLDCTGCAVCF